MGDRLRGLLPAYKAGRLDEYILLQFGSLDEYVRFCLRRALHQQRQFLDVMYKLQVYPPAK